MIFALFDFIAHLNNKDRDVEKENAFAQRNRSNYCVVRFPLGTIEVSIHE